MKIVYIANARIPSERAHGKQIMKTCEALAAKSNLELWLPDRPQLEQFRGIDPFTYFSVKTKFPIRKFHTLDFLNYINKLPTILKVLAYLLEEASFLFFLSFNIPKADFVYTRSISVSLISKFLWRKITIYEIHDLPTKTFIRKIYGLFLQKLSGVVVISHGLETDLHVLGVTKISLIPDGVDGSLYKNSSISLLYVIPTNKKLILYTGALTAAKGIFTLLDSTRFFNKNIALLIAGGNLTMGDADKVKKYVLKHHLKNISFLGIVPDNLISSLQKIADILVLPNSNKTINSSRYTSPMKLFEYLATGVPIVATATPANKEILIHLKNSYLVRSDDPQDLARGIKKILSDGLLARKISSQAKKDVNNYTWDKRAERIIKFIAKV